MKIVNHLLYDNNNKAVEYKQTPNKGGTLNAQYLVMHYTAATQGRGSISWMTNPAAKASAHLLIDRDGTITQFAPFNVVTWHAGESKWNGIIGLNKASIGIELVNGGRLKKSAGNWVCSVDNKIVPDADVVFGTHKNETAEGAWQNYTDYQLQVAAEVSALLIKQYGLKDFLGHEDIAPIRKSDPGPAFPMGSFKSKVLGRKDDKPHIHKTTEPVNIRSGAGTNFATLTKDPMPKGTPVQVLKREGNWSFVEVETTVFGLNDLEGWVFSKYLVE